MLQVLPKDVKEFKNNQYQIPRKKVNVKSVLLIIFPLVILIVVFLNLFLGNEPKHGIISEIVAQSNTPKSSIITLTPTSKIDVSGGDYNEYINTKYNFSITYPSATAVHDDCEQLNGSYITNAIKNPVYVFEDIANNIVYISSTKYAFLDANQSIAKATLCLQKDTDLSSIKNSFVSSKDVYNIVVDKFTFANINSQNELSSFIYTQARNYTNIAITYTSELTDSATQTFSYTIYPKDKGATVAEDFSALHIIYSPKFKLAISWVGSGTEAKWQRVGNPNVYLGALNDPSAKFLNN